MDEDRVLSDEQLGRLEFDDRGLIPAVVQQHDTGEVLMVAWMDAAAIAETVSLRETVFFSRSRGERWHKGESSGNTQRVIDLRVDCDGDTLLLLVDQQGERLACHTGQRSCFHRRLPQGPSGHAVAAPALAAPAETDPHRS